MKNHRNNLNSVSSKCKGCQRRSCLYFFFVFFYLRGKKCVPFSTGIFRWCMGTTMTFDWPYRRCFNASSSMLSSAPSAMGATPTGGIHFTLVGSRPGELSFSAERREKWARKSNVSPGIQWKILFARCGVGDSVWLNSHKWYDEKQRNSFFWTKEKAKQRLDSPTSLFRSFAIERR